MGTKISSIEKMRNIISWADWQSESFNDRFKSIADIEKAYNYCQNHESLEFLDNQGIEDLDTKELKNLQKEIKELLGYQVI